MYHCKALLLVALIGLTASAQTINLRDKVANQGGKPFAGAIVTLADPEPERHDRYGRYLSNNADRCFLLKFIDTTACTAHEPVVF